jgi:hypothetical protein
MGHFLRMPLRADEGRNFQILDAPKVLCQTGRNASHRAHLDHIRTHSSAAMSATAAGVSFPVLCGQPRALPGLVPRLISAHASSAWSGWFGCGVPPSSPSQGRSRTRESGVSSQRQNFPQWNVYGPGIAQNADEHQCALAQLTRGTAIWAGARAVTEEAAGSVLAPPVPPVIWVSEPD